MQSNSEIFQEKNYEFVIYHDLTVCSRSPRRPSEVVTQV